jgi:hypothetical protein
MLLLLLGWSIENASRCPSSGAMSIEDASRCSVFFWGSLSRMQTDALASSGVVYRECK